MKHRLKITLVVIVALQLLAAHPAAGQGAQGAGGAPPLDASTERRGEPMTQKSGPRGRRKRAGVALTPGVWGGEHIRFEVTEGGVSIEYDCAHGTVEGRIVVGREGRFSVTGLHYEERGGPVRAGDSAGGYPVRLTGRVCGSLLKLKVTRADTKELIGTFTLARDREAELVKCR